MTVSILTIVLRIATLGILAMLTSVHAAVVTARVGDTIRVPCVASPTPTPESMHLLVFLNETKLNVNGGWNSSDIDVKQKGNAVQVNLRNGVEVPIFVHGNNGNSYFIVVTPVAAGQAGDPEIRIASEAPGAAGGTPAREDDQDPLEVNGGSWESTTNLVLKIHKHIRGGRKLVSVQQAVCYNAEIMAKEHRRVPGKVIKKSDDFLVVDYQTWSLERVTAHLRGVTYTGRDPSVDFNYLDMQTDTSVAIFSFPRWDRPPLYALQSPKVRLEQGLEQLFIYYSEIPQEPRQ